MDTKLRPSGIEGVGDMPWGTHFCLFYETKDDLLNVLLRYFKAGLENNEFFPASKYRRSAAGDARGCARFRAIFVGGSN